MQIEHNNARAVLYSVKWQILRVQCLASNRKDGGWESIEGAKANIETLDVYLAGGLGHQERTRRTWRVVNLLNAVLLGYGSRIFNDDVRRQLVTEKRDQVSEWHNIALKWSDYGDWDWSFVASDLAERLRPENPVRGAERKRLELVRNNLMGRVRTANYKARKGTGGMQYRGELITFLGLLEEALNRP